MMVRWPLANSSSGPLVISTRSAFLAGGSSCAAAGWNASTLPTVTVIASVRSSPLMDVLVHCGRETDRPSRVRHLATVQLRIGGLGTGATPQTADAQGGSGGVGIRESFPWVDAEAFAEPGVPVVHVPVKVLMLG